MSNDPNPAIWTGPVIRFIEDNLPVLDPSGEEWDHMFTFAYQFGCDALIALGEAEETGRGARPRAHPRLPEILPRWDDICVTVLSLAHQCGLLSYRLSDGRESPEAAAWWGRHEGEIMPPPNGWHRHVSLVMLTFAMMAVIRHHANAALPPKTMRRPHRHP